MQAHRIQTIVGKGNIGSPDIWRNIFRDAEAPGNKCMFADFDKLVNGYRTTDDGKITDFNMKKVEELAAAKEKEILEL